MPSLKGTSSFRPICLSITVFSAAQKHDYLSFYAQEVEARGELRYPPFSHVGTLLLRGKDEKQVEEAAHAVRDQLQTLLSAGQA